MPLLKLKNASYPEPDALALVNEYDLGRDGSKWSHNWTPLNPAAVAIKEKRSPGSKGGKSRLSTSTVRPSRAKVAGAKGREASPKAGVRSTHPIGSPVLAKQPGIETETRGHVTGHTDAGMVKVQYKDRKGAQVIGTFNPAHTRVLTGKEAAQHDFEHGSATARPGLDPSKTAKSVISDGKNMSAADHTRMAIHHNEEAKKALDAGDRTKANAHVGAMRAHNSAALQAASADDIVKLRETAQPGPQKDAVNAEIRRRVADPKTTNSTGLRTLGGYGTNDLKAIAGQKGAYASSPSSADTIAKAEAELKSRGYVKSPTGVWAKPKAPQRKQKAATLKGRATPVKRGTKSIAGVRFKPGQ